jgi:DNA-binding CsgD family transcriptional regulator
MPESREEMRAALRSILTKDEIRLLALYIDGTSQRELARTRRKRQETISYRLRRAVAKLRAAGLNVEMPGRGRTQTTIHTVQMDDVLMKRAIVERQDGTLLLKGFASREAS